MTHPTRITLSCTREGPKGSASILLHFQAEDGLSGWRVKLSEEEAIKLSKDMMRCVDELPL